MINVRVIAADIRARERKAEEDRQATDNPHLERIHLGMRNGYGMAAMILENALANEDALNAVPCESEGTLPCPFCGGSDVSDGELLYSASAESVIRYTQSECNSCGAIGPKGYLDKDEIDYGDVKAIAAWNRRAK